MIADDADDYICVVRGYSSGTGKEVVLQHSVTLVVETTGSPAVGEF